MQINSYVLSREYCIESPDHVDSADMVSYLALLRRVANADGICPEEEQFVSLVSASLGLEAELVEAAVARAGSNASLAELAGEVTDGGFRACIYRDAYRLALADGVVTSGEENALADLSASLGISGSLAGAIRTWVGRDIDLQVELGELLRDAALPG